MLNISAKDLDNLFTYHPPVGNDVDTYQQIRQAGHAFATVICATVPPSDDRDRAITTIRDAVMQANAAVACAPKYHKGGFLGAGGVIPGGPTVGP